MIDESVIRERAHRIWESEGRPSGRADSHWALASAEIAAEGKRAKPRKAAAASAAPAARVKSAPAKPRKAASKA